MEPTITFLFNHNGADIPSGFNGTNDPNSGSWMEMSPSYSTLVWTGGGIIGSLPDLSVSGTRDACIKPSVTSFVIPQCFVEQGNTMYLTTCGRNTNRYCMGVFVYGTASSDLYAEMWDDSSLSTTNLEILSGTPNNSYNSMINAIRTTQSEPPWHPGWSGADTAAAFLRGTEHRVPLANASSVTNQMLYFNIFVELPTDCSTWHVTPVLACRYLYT